jgi:protein-L-isoaspartate(D-aspartate) O-methyltransferase
MEEADYRRLREDMVSSQLVLRGIRDERVLQAMRTIPRHLFVPAEMRHRAYDDGAFPIGSGQTISQPYMVAVMAELLELKGTEKVLEVGTGSGYQAAVLATLATEVFTIERHAQLAEQARTRLFDLGYTNVNVHAGDGTLGLPEDAPFDRILITAGSPRLPEPLKNQLADGGIILAPVGSQYSQELIKARKAGNDFQELYSTPCVFVPLIGEFGWHE